jgi:hypothetical protein
MLDAASGKKKTLTAWEQRLDVRESALLVANSQLDERRGEIDVMAQDLSLRTERVLQAERDVSEKLERLAIERADFMEAAGVVARQEEDVYRRECDVARAENDVALQQRELSAMHDEYSAKRKALRISEHTVAEKERALKSWLLELEYRQKAIAHRESHPRPYLGGSNAMHEKDERVLDAGRPQQHAHGEPPAKPGRFDRALVSLQVSHLQRAYLGASAAFKASRASALRHGNAQAGSSRPASRVSTRGDPTAGGGSRAPSAAAILPPMDTTMTEERTVVPTLTRMIDDALTDDAMHAELRLLEKEFRDLSAGFAIMDDEERRQIFTNDEIQKAAWIVEQECRTFDEHHFLQSLRAITMPKVSVTAAPQDNVLVATVEQWVAQRLALVDERLRRSSAARVELLDRGIRLLKGRVRSHDQRVAALTADGRAPRSPSRQLRSPNVVDSTLTPPSPMTGTNHERRAHTASDDDLSPSWSNPAASFRTTATSAVMASPRSTRTTSSVRLRHRLVGALPSELQVYYTK